MPYSKRKQDCTNKSGEKGTYVTIKKQGGKKQCWKSKAAFERAQTARHAQDEADKPENDGLAWVTGNVPGGLTGGPITEALFRQIIRRFLREEMSLKK